MYIVRCLFPLSVANAEGYNVSYRPICFVAVTYKTSRPQVDVELRHCNNLSCMQTYTSTVELNMDTNK